MGDNSYKYRKEETDLMDEVDMFMEDINETSYGEVEIPDTLRRGIRKHVNICEEAKLGAKVSEADKEYIRLGKIYEKKRKLRKYYVLAAVLVLALAFGMTSMGGPEKVFQKFSWVLAGREQTNVDSDSDIVDPTSGMKEEEAYALVEEKFGFYPVKLNYLPEGVEFIKMEIGDETQGIQLIYGKGGEANILMFIHPNYRDGSYSTDFEDKLLKEYKYSENQKNITVKQYEVEETGEIRWSAEFLNNNIHYFMSCLDMGEQDFEEILKNLYFF